MTSSPLPDYEIYALRYATVARRRPENFLVHDPHDGPMPMDYFVWVIKGSERVFLVDTGFNKQASDARKRTFLRCPIESLSLLGINPDHVSDVIITHLHYDHAGNVNKLPNARIHLQEKELRYATSAYMKHELLRHAYSVDDVVEIVRGLYNDRIEFYTGDTVLAPGIELIHVGGHTAGLQAVRVHTQRGWVVLASDASHFYENIHANSPFPIVFNVGDMLNGYKKLMGLCQGLDHFIPGHDPLVLTCFPGTGGQNTDIVSLHAPPLQPIDQALQKRQLAT